MKAIKKHTTITTLIRNQNSIEMGPPVTKVIHENNLGSSEYDGLILVTSPKAPKKSPLFDVIENAIRYDAALSTEITVLPIPKYPGGRIIHSPTGPIDPDYDDVRVYRKAAFNAIKRAIKSGFQRPLLVLQEHFYFQKDAELVTILGALEALYTPIQVREGGKTCPITTLGIYSDNSDKAKSLIDLALPLEQGRRVACDIGDADPERMSPPRVEEYIVRHFADSSIKISTVREKQNFAKDYPLFEAVNRAAEQIQRHQGRIVYLEYNPSDSGKIKKTLFLVGKGVTFDTGGIDVKISGAMTGMSRDKCGAAAVIGFMDVVNSLKPPNVRVVAGVSLVRNSIGANGYVCDELVIARSGARVRIGNTDAEGRMVMADVLCKLKEEALNAVNPHLFTIATLTGHAHLAVGDGYTIVMDNGPAKRAGNSKHLQSAGDEIGDMVEISTVRRDDFLLHKPHCEGDDVSQANSQPSSRTPRGHQGPAAFLILASGLDKHGSESDIPLKYSHIDIAGSAGDFPHPATGAPVFALANAYLLKE